MSDEVNPLEIAMEGMDGTIDLGHTTGKPLTVSEKELEPGQFLGIPIVHRKQFDHKGMPTEEVLYEDDDGKECCLVWGRKPIEETVVNGERRPMHSTRYPKAAGPQGEQAAREVVQDAYEKYWKLN